MKKIIGLLTILFLIPSISNAHWVDSQMDVLQNAGILQEVFEIEKDNKILNRAITREEFFSLVAVANNITKAEISKEFVDANDVEIKFVGYIGGLIEEGIVAGALKDGALYINPKVSITRQEAVIILSKSLELSDENYEINFIDSNVISKWAKPYFAGVISAKIINGYPDNSVKPLKNITVAEAIAIIANSYNSGYFSGESVIEFTGTGEGLLKDGANDQAAFNIPSDIVIKGEKIFVADTGNNAIRVVENNVVSIFAGSDIGRNEYNEAIGSFKDGENALFDKPTYMLSLENGILLTDTKNNLIRFINNDGYTTTFAGRLDSGLKNGKVNVAKFNKPTGIAVDSQGNIYVADTGNNIIRKIDVNKNVTTFAGNNKAGYKDGNVKNAQFNSPMGITVVNDVIYVADSGNQRIRMIKDGVVSTYAGNGNDKDDYGIEILGDFIDGDKMTAKFNYPINIEADSNGNLYVADKGNAAIRKIDTKGNVTTIVKDNIKRPSGIAIKGNILYVTDTLLNRVFKVRL